jgi:hypothetical protein
MPDSQVIKQGGTTVAVREHLADEMTVGHDMAPTAAAAAAKAEIEARILAAWKRPRDVDQFREGILKDCRRPGFAEVALYRKPVGRKKNAETGRWEDSFAIDFSVRFIESAIQHWRNTHITERIDYEDADTIAMTVGVVDVERNVGYSFQATLDKLVERKEVKAGRKTRGMRENSYGDVVYLVEATKDEMRNVQGAERSKLLRDQGKRLLPRDILDECREQIERTIADETAKDPDSAKKKVLDKFSALGVSPTMLKEYLGRPVETLTPKDLNELAPLYNGLKEGNYSWADIMRTRNEAADGEDKPADGVPPRSKARDKVMSQPPFTPPTETK